jgi:hypothetical protein
VRHRDEATQAQVDAILERLRRATDRRTAATEVYLAECVEWEDEVRAAYRGALRVTSKELAPTVSEMANELEISEKSLQLVRHRQDGTAAIPRPNRDPSQPMAEPAGDDATES